MENLIDYNKLWKSGTKEEFDQKVNRFCKTLRVELIKMGFEFEEHPDKGIRGGQKAINDKECQCARVYCDLNAMRLNQSDRRYGNWLSDDDFNDLIKFKNQLPNEQIEKKVYSNNAVCLQKRKWR